MTNPNIIPGTLFRCAASKRSLLPLDCAIVELRTADEISDCPTPSEHRKVLHVPLPVSKSGHGVLSPMEQSYLAWVHSGGKVFPRVLEEYCEEKAIAVSCLRGVDRTGLIVAVLHLLLGTDMHSVLTEYVRVGGADTKAHHLQICIVEIDRVGGLFEYLRACGCSTNGINQFRRAFLRVPNCFAF